MAARRQNLLYMNNATPPGMKICPWMKTDHIKSMAEMAIIGVVGFRPPLMLSRVQGNLYINFM